MRIPLAVCVAVMSLLCPAVTALAQGRTSCDRMCLTGLLDRYVDALIARDPSRLPVTANVRFTENGQRLVLGDGLWHTVTRKGGYRLDMADVEAGQAILMGTIALMLGLALRLWWLGLLWWGLSHAAGLLAATGSSATLRVLLTLLCRVAPGAATVFARRT